MDHKTARMAEMCRHLQFLKSDNPCSQAHVDFCPLLYTRGISFHSAKKADGRSVWSYLWPELYLSRLRLSAVALIPRLPCDHCCSACSWTGGWRDTFAYVASRSHFFRASAAFPRVLLRDRVGRGGDVPRGE